jgi:hypothetical protein
MESDTNGFEGTHKVDPSELREEVLCCTSLGFDHPLTVNLELQEGEDVSNSEHKSLIR